MPTEKEMKLSPLQNKVIYSLQNGFVIITDSDVKGAWIGNKKGQFHISNRCFWNLVDKGLIYQQSNHPQDYILTKLGKEIKTKPVTL